MESLQLIQLSIADLSRMMEEASEKGAYKALITAGKAVEIEEQLSTEASMQLTGFATKDAFRKYCKDNGIQPVDTRARRNYYLRSHLLNIKRPKYARK